MSKKSLFCSVENCDRRVTARSLCGMHYHRWQRHGDVSIVKGSDQVIGNTPEERFWAQVSKTDDVSKCWEWEGYVSPHGYGIKLFNGKQERAHRIAWFLTYGQMPTKSLLHSCDNKICTNVNHLREGTQRENIDDAVERNRNVKGETHGMVKLDEQKVLAIRRRHSEGESQSALAREHGVTQAAISLIIKRINWSHI